MNGSAGRAGTVKAVVSPGAAAARTQMSVEDVFRRIASALDQVGIGYMLTGSFASAHYGVSRSTQDIDLMIEGTLAELQAFVGGSRATNITPT